MPAFKINTVEFTGNIAADAQIRATPNGTTFINFVLIHNDRYRTAAGEIREDVTPMRCTVRVHKDAKTDIYARLIKGLGLHVSGKLKGESWVDKDSGKTIYATSIAVREWKFADYRDPKSDGSKPDQDLNHLVGEALAEEEPPF